MNLRSITVPDRCNKKHCFHYSVLQEEPGWQTGSKEVRLRGGELLLLPQRCQSAESAAQQRRGKYPPVWAGITGPPAGEQPGNGGSGEGGREGMEERCAQYLINSTWDSCVVTVFELLQGSVIHNNSITQKLNLGSFFLFKKMYLDILNLKLQPSILILSSANVYVIYWPCRYVQTFQGVNRKVVKSSQKTLKKKWHFSEKRQQQKLGHNHCPLAQRKKLHGFLEESRLV